jgi:hypothetical protein
MILLKTKNPILNWIFDNLRTYAKKSYNLDGVIRANAIRPYVTYTLRKS